jgi:hypothetical protein
VDRSFPLLPLGDRRVCRDTELAELRDRLAGGRFVVLRGTFSGVGATRLASEYGHAHVSEYPAARLIERTRQGMLVVHARVLVRVLDVSGGRRGPAARALLRVFAETKDSDARRVLAPHARLAVRQGEAAPALLSELAVVVSAEDAGRHAFGTDEAKRAVIFAREAEGEAGGPLTKL